jgi:hypothetical protein
VMWTMRAAMMAGLRLPTLTPKLLLYARRYAIAPDGPTRPRAFTRWPATI